MSATITLPRLSVDPMTLDRWIRAGLLHLDRPGTGYRRSYPACELRAMAALDSLRRLAGADPSPQGGKGHPARRQLQHTVAELARTNEPGTAHEITTPVPWIHHVLIVPEP